MKGLQARQIWLAGRSARSAQTAPDLLGRTLKNGAHENFLDFVLYDDVDP